MTIPRCTEPVPWLTTAQMIEVDRAMVEDYHIELIQMMENAGRNLAHLARNRFLDGNAKDRQIAVLAGTGGNGGGALVCARRLHNWGAKVHIFTTKPVAEFTPIPAHQLDILEKMKVTMRGAEALDDSVRADLIVDGVIGYSLKGTPRGNAAAMIRWANGNGAPILALDVPSGVDTSTGATFDPAIRASATLTLALPKAGLNAPGVNALVGELYLADISVPPGLYSGMGLSVGPIFAASDIVRLR